MIDRQVFDRQIKLYVDKIDNRIFSGVVYTVVYMILFYAWVKRTEPRYNEMPPKQSHMEMA